ncbi:MAG: helix-hairpin-helix domain-containing protein [Candidatus Hodarchaeales archaeon]|jgi:ribosomal protein S13/ABC-type phosphate/phosphonate transport system ATPase subunit
MLKEQAISINGSSRFCNNNLPGKIKVKAKSLTDLRGIGEGLAKKLIDNFGSETAALEALENNDVEAISRIEGVGERLATKLIRIYHEVNPETFLVTQDSLAIYRRLIKKIQAHACTAFARAKAILLSPITDITKIRENQELTANCQSIANSLVNQEKEISSLLKSLASLKLGTNLIDTGDRIIYTDDLDLQERLEAHETSQYCSIDYTESFETLLEKSQGSSEQLIFLTKEDFHGDEQGITLLGIDDAFNFTKTVPEKHIAFFAANKKTLTVLLRLLDIFSAKISGNFDDLTNNNEVEELTKLLGQIKETGEIEENIDPELDRINAALEGLENALMDIEVELNESLTEFFSRSKIELEGQKLLELLKSGSDTTEQLDVREFLDPSLYLHVEEELEKREEEIIKKFRLKEEEDSLVNELFPRQLELPVAHSSDRLDQLISVLSAKAKSRAYSNKVRIAEKLKTWKEFCILLNRRILELDYQLMIGKFMQKNNLALPEIMESELGIKFDNGINIDLLDEIGYNSEGIQKVRYQVGTIDVLKERVTILSGANSGGKTTLLMLLAQVTVLSHMGIGVPATNCKVSMFKEFHYYKKSAGIVSAGAFETFLKAFTQILKGESKIVLADEMESISEPGASALVISAFLDALNQSTESCGVFVSHLAAQIKKHCQTNVRIDGIEASGLDDKLRLIVNRNPVYGLYARSTPQLIVERLAKLGKGKEREIFSDILSRFRTLQD